MLVLPSKKKLLNLLNAIPFKCGVDNRVMLLIKEIISSLLSPDRYCALMFDEMSLKEHVQYCPKEDKIVGFVDSGSSRCADWANYAMVFMLRGLRKKWKQPVACYFTHGGMKGGKLKAAVEEVLACCFAVGLNIVVTVCDMGTNNVSALKQLGAKFPDPVFHFIGHEIAVVFDPPHLLKCTRNMFLSHIVRGVNFRGEIPITGAARWEHIEKMYEEDKKSIFRLAPKVTEGHLAPTSSERMKVSTAAQVMSHTVAAAIHSFVSRDILPPEATVTASFVADVDELFDSFNGSDRYPDTGKPLRCCLSESSPHLEYWQEKAKSLIHNWQFCTDPVADRRLRRERKQKTPPLRPGKKRCTVSHPPSQWGWITSINAVINVWNVVSEAGFSYLQLRALNQNPLENLFGSIRSYCGANTNPTCVQFAAALKTAIVNGLAFKSFSVETGDASILSSAYVAVFIAHKLLEKVKCDKCKLSLAAGGGSSSGSAAAKVPAAWWGDCGLVARCGRAVLGTARLGLADRLVLSSRCWVGGRLCGPGLGHARGLWSMLAGRRGVNLRRVRRAQPEASWSVFEGVSARWTDSGAVGVGWKLAGQTSCVSKPGGHSEPPNPGGGASLRRRISVGAPGVSLHGTFSTTGADGGDVAGQSGDMMASNPGGGASIRRRVGIGTPGMAGRFSGRMMSKPGGGSVVMHEVGNELQGVGDESGRASSGSSVCDESGGVRTYLCGGWVGRRAAAAGGGEVVASGDVVDKRRVAGSSADCGVPVPKNGL
ncbi:uncharacterized protein LOC134528887 [Bacillus rossius redtenbacheri]|uniref:uncharacterized protein LOC134528887 n=1 Tax=Bacillus rossius redtenbacheri TaxID=93214 RepID=UPI002FDDE768